MESKEIIEAIADLNCEIYDQIENDYIYLEYSTNSFSDIIDFLGIQIWNSENDERRYIDEENDVKEDLEIYLRKEINKIIDELQKIKLNEGQIK
jgi:hypothetical protein